MSLQLARRLLGTPVPQGFVPSLGMHALSRHQLSCFRPEAHLLEGPGVLYVRKDVVEKAE